MLFWAAGQALLLSRTASAALPTALTRGLGVFAVTLVGGAVAGGLYWALHTPWLRVSTPLQVATAAVGAEIYLTALTIAASLAHPGGPWARVTQPNFILSTSVVALVFGWVIAKDPFALTTNAERVYLTPAEFAALAPPEQARLRPDSKSPSDPRDSIIMSNRGHR
jgi:hypothetical protein